MFLFCVICVLNAIVQVVCFLDVILLIVSLLVKDRQTTKKKKKYIKNVLKKTDSKQMQIKHFTANQMSLNIYHDTHKESALTALITSSPGSLGSHSLMTGLALRALQKAQMLFHVRRVTAARAWHKLSKARGGKF